MENYNLRIPNLVTSGGMRAYKRLKRREKDTQKGQVMENKGRDFRTVSSVLIY